MKGGRIAMSTCQMPALSESMIQGVNGWTYAIHYIRNISPHIININPPPIRRIKIPLPIPDAGNLLELSGYEIPIEGNGIVACESWPDLRRSLGCGTGGLGEVELCYC